MARSDHVVGPRTLGWPWHAGAFLPPDFCTGILGVCRRFSHRGLWCFNADGPRRERGRRTTRDGGPRRLPSGRMLRWAGLQCVWPVNVCNCLEPKVYTCRLSGVESTWQTAIERGREYGQLDRVMALVSFPSEAEALPPSCAGYSAMRFGLQHHWGFVQERGTLGLLDGHRSWWRRKGHVGLDDGRSHGFQPDYGLEISSSSFDRS